MKHLTFKEFQDKYNPILNPFTEESPFGGFMFETYGQELQEVQTYEPSQIWTIIETDGTIFLSNGLHLINKYGYMITSFPFEGQRGTIEVNLD